MKKIAIIGASYLQSPLIRKAKQMGIETHVFAWECGDIGEKEADYFYPVSIVEKDEILDICKKIKIDGVCSIASDLAAITVNYVAYHMGLVCNSPECVEVSTNKYKMRKCFEFHGDPSPRSIKVGGIEDVDTEGLTYPVIVKPLDRSGSRGITRLDSDKGLNDAIEYAKQQGFEKHALIEEFVEGQEYSVEYVTWQGKHHFLVLTKKYTTGAPDYIETGHLEPAPVDAVLLDNIKNVVSHALDSLGIEYGASHSELKVDCAGTIKIIEIGARMGGDLIGSSLVELATGFDFVKAAIDIALGNAPELTMNQRGYAAIRFILNEHDLNYITMLQQEYPDIIIDQSIQQITGDKVTDSRSRFGYCLFASDDITIIDRYMPD